MKIEGQVIIPSGCAISAVISKEGNKMSGEMIINSMKPMHDRSNGLGGGFAGYGIYPEYKEFYALHMFYDTRDTRKECEGYSWTAHGRYPTNTPGWWGGAHPFTLLDYSIVHNGIICSVYRDLPLVKLQVSLLPHSGVTLQQKQIWKTRKKTTSYSLPVKRLPSEPWN